MSGLKKIVQHYEGARRAGVDCGQYHVSLYDEDRNGYFIWYITIKGPKDSLYEGGEYDFKLWFSDHYPFKPPVAGCSSLLYHPNINRTSYGVKLDHIRSQWHPKNTGITIIEGFLKAMVDPDPDRQFANDGKHLCPEIARQFKEDREKFNETARAWAKKAAPLPGNTAFWWELPPKEEPKKVTATTPEVTATTTPEVIATTPEVTATTTPEVTATTTPEVTATTTPEEK